MPITTIGLDADDTLWHNETIFRLTHERFADLLSEHHDRDRIDARLAATEQRNLRLYGYGIKGFTLSMIETAMELTDGAPPPRVISEILAAGREMLSHPVETLPGVAATLNRLSEQGFKLSIDDFGTGYSSLAYLKRLPVDELKIDKSFVMGMETGEDDAMIVRSTIDLAHNLGLTVVAEGVETAAILERLRLLACDEAQGYHIARPLPVDDFLAWQARQG